MKPTDRRRTAVLSLITAVLAVAATASVVWAQEPELSEEHRQELISLGAIIGAALQGEIVPPTDDPFGWANDFLKSSDQSTFVPFTLSVDQAKLSTSRAALYIYVTPQDAPAPVPAAEETADAAGAVPAEPAVPAAAFEDAYHVDLGQASENGIYDIRRGFWVPSGAYTVYVALSESDVPDGTEAKTMMLKQELSVPNLWSDELATSSIILAARVEALTAPPPADQQLANPYTLGTMRIVPKRDQEYLKSEEISLVFFVYNAGLNESGMPDVTVEYTFNTRGADGDEYFNKTTPQDFNEQTLPPGFDLMGGHQLVGGQAVPLSGFPEADYQLEIKVTDNTNGALLIRQVAFSVSAS
jgi:hypothetical protein